MSPLLHFNVQCNATSGNSAWRCALVQGWEELMLVVESSMAGGRKEVALAAVAVITTVMQAHGTTKAVSRRYAHSTRLTAHCLHLLAL